MVIISCDFTGTDWDEELPMIEGHKGSVLSLGALAMAVEQAAPAKEQFECTMCLRTHQPLTKAWRHADPPPNANPKAVICWDCIQQADRSFAQDPDTEWTRHIKPSERWR